MTSAVSPKAAAALTRKMRDDPAWFCENVLGVTPYGKQIELIESVRDHEQTSVVGANAVGKDWMVGRVICWWQASRYPAKTIITGPTARQVSDIVWREARQAFYGSKIPLGGRMLPTESRWEVSDEHFALGFSTDKAWNLTGFHSPNLLVVITEAHNFSDANLVSLKRLLPNRLLMTGNPFSASGEFFDSHHGKRNLYNAISISAYDTPNVILGNEDLPGVVNRKDIEKMAADWGEDSPIFRATVHSEFAQTEDGLIPLAWLIRAQEPSAEPESDEEAPIDAGVDVAGPGDDETVLTVRCGSRVLEQKAWHDSDPRGQVAAALQPYKARLRNVNVDSAGIGWNFYLHLIDLGFPAMAINVGESARDGEKYRNLKAELYWGLRQRFQDEDIHDLPEECVSQVASLRYRHNSRGQIEIESKDEARRRGISSPDRAESVMLAFAEMPAGKLEWI